MKFSSPPVLTGLIIVIVLLSLPACVTNIASRANLADTSFTVGLTTSKDVVDALGLPEKVLRSEDGSQQYLYPGAARISGFVVGSAGGGASFQNPGVLDAAINNSIVRDGAIYTFDAKGILQHENSPKTRIK